MSSRKSSGRTNRRQHNTARDYPRTARLNELLREILAEELERIDDDRLMLFTIISVDAESDLRRAVVYYDCLDGEAGDEQTMAALGDLRIRLQAAIGRQARIKRTPELSFAPDPSVRSGERIDAILKDVISADPADPADPSGEGDDADIA
jgi:ribosome-binding factor A